MSSPFGYPVGASADGIELSPAAITSPRLRVHSVWRSWWSLRLLCFPVEALIRVAPRIEGVPRRWRRAAPAPLAWDEPDSALTAQPCLHREAMLDSFCQTPKIQESKIQESKIQESKAMSDHWAAVATGVSLRFDCLCVRSRSV
jgi:hypothetical protein